MTNKDFYDRHITVIEDFFDLPEQTQDILLINPYFDYEFMWDKITGEQKFLLLESRYDFDYEKVWDKLSLVERLTVIRVSQKFDNLKYLPEPTEVELDLLLNRHDFDSEECFESLSIDQKIRVCSKRIFNYKKFWSELTMSMKLEVVKYNSMFEPLPYIEELKQVDLEDYESQRYGHPKSAGVKTMLDIFSERRKSNKYESIWSEMDEQQKMNVMIKCEDFVVDDKDEAYDLLKKFPFKLMDFFTEKVIPFDHFNIQELTLEEMENGIKELTIDLITSFNLLSYDEVVEKRSEVKNGNTTTLIYHPDLIEIIPFCIVKVNSGELKHGYYLFDIQKNKFTRIIDYNYILRSSKLERILNNIAEE